MTQVTGSRCLACRYRLRPCASASHVPLLDPYSTVNGTDGSARWRVEARRGALTYTGYRDALSFRFGSVRGSYAARKGDDRNVGVIGVAMFHERGVPAWPWDPREVERRQDANPFPGQYAAPPP